MKEKKFIRFICNTKNHPRGEKIKTLNKIAKIYDDEDKFLYIRKPYIKALENQIEIDIEGIDYKPYLPLHHFKHSKEKIIKKSDNEIKNIDAKIAKDKKQKETERQQREQEKQNNINIINDDSKSDKEKLNALIKLYKGD